MKNQFAVLIFVLAAVFVAPALAQKQTVNEDFELNITQDRITETNFERSTAVQLNDQSRGNLTVRIGVGATAQRIDVILRGIYGRVRFRASLEQIERRIERLQTTPTNENAPK